MKAFLKILFFILVIFQTNISVAKVFVFDVVATEIILLLMLYKIKMNPM